MSLHYGDAGAVELPGPGPRRWVWPWWLQRQLDPASPAWQPADLVGVNRTGRNWTVIGLPDGPDRWVVDRCGLLAPSGGGWALDWWVGAEDRWRLPSLESSVRQRLVGDAPVVETAMRVPGGDVLVRHWAVPSAEGDLAVMEIHNEATTAVAIAVALRPVGPSGVTVTRRIAVVGAALQVDGVDVARARVRPRQAALSTGASGDVATTVTGNATPEARDGSVDCGQGWATAAMVWPLVRQASLRIELPGRRPLPSRRRRPSAAASAASGAARPAAADPGAGPGLPVPMEGGGHGEAARGWAARTARRTRLDLPPGSLASALAAQRGHLLLASGAALDADPPAARMGGTRVVGTSVGGARVGGARIVGALSRAGLREEAAVHLRRWLDAQRRNGSLGADEVDTASSLWALGVWADTGDDDGLVRGAPLAVARAVERVASAPASDPVGEVWMVAGVRSGARLLGRLGEDRAEGTADAWARRRRDGLLGHLSSAADAAPDGPSSDAGLLAVVLGVVGARHPAAVAARRAVLRPPAGLPAGSIAGPPPILGVHPERCLRYATSAVMAGEDATATVGWVLSVASPTWTWPTVVAPRLGTGSHGSGHDAEVAAALWEYGRSLLVVERHLERWDHGEPDLGDHDPGAHGAGAQDAGGGRPGRHQGASAPPRASLDILPALPGEWIGRPIEVHGLATTAGALSYAVRWHAERPAILWELDGETEVRLTSSGLDPGWEATGKRGEALLEPVPAPAPVAAGPGEDPDGAVGSLL